MYQQIFSIPIVEKIYFTTEKLFLWRSDCQDCPFLPLYYVSYTVTICWGKCFESAMFQIRQEYIQEASKRRVTYTASGYCLTTAFVRVHADISTVMLRIRLETLGRNILNLGQAWRERIP